MPQKKTKSTGNASLKKQKAQNIMLFSNTPKKTMKKEGYSSEYTNRIYKNHLKSVS